MTIKPLGALGAAALLMGAVVPPAHAGDSWFSRVNGVPAKAFVESNPAGIGTLRADSVQAVFDITISIESDPQGDDDADVDDGAADDAQNTYEDAIKEFADAVCQSTNLGHKLGTVRIFRKHVQQNSADILVNTNCAANAGPRANPSGFGVAGKRIWHCENWPGYGATPLIDDAKGWGFTAAHEWGHYAYGLYDEYVGSAATGSIYQPRSTDTPVNPSIMNSQWCAANPSFCPAGQSGASSKFLEFSTDQVAPYSGAGETAQKRVFGESGWETLIRSTSSDPKEYTFLGFTFGHAVPPRTRYTSLIAKSPLAGPDYAIVDDEADCRSELDIRWMKEDLVTYVLLDTSGSMSGTGIANARTASKLLVDALPLGSSAIGVGEFGNKGDFASVFAIQQIPDPDTGVKAAAKAAIDTLVAGGGTPLFEGGLAALPVIEAFTTAAGGDQAAVLYMLTDGFPNSYTNEAAMVAAYTAAGIPIITFGFGDFIDSAMLTRVATATGGQYFASPLTLAEIQAAFLAANAAVSSSVILGSGAATVPAGAGESLEITVDDTLLDVFVSATWIGACADLTYAVLEPAGTDITGDVEESCTVASGQASLTVRLSEANITTFGTGTYFLEFANAGGADIEVTGIVSANAKEGGTYNIALNLSSGQTVAYPAPVAIQATVQGDAPITGLTVEAEVTDPTGGVTVLAMLDDGQSGDFFPGDGTYGAVFNYTMNGQHRIVVNAESDGSGETSVTGVLFATDKDGEAQTPTPSPVLAAFSRAAIGTLGVSGMAADDHVDDPTGACTGLVDDNGDVPGRIDAAGDVDCFLVIPNDPTVDMAFRATGFSSGMDAVLTVYASDGTTVLATADAANTASADSGVIAVVDVADVDAAGMVFTVAHSDDTASMGGYLASAGPTIFSDAPLTPTPAVPNAGGGGGAIDPWTLLGLLGLAGAGAMARRRRAA